MTNPRDEINKKLTAMETEISRIRGQLGLSPITEDEIDNYKPQHNTLKRLYSWYSLPRFFHDTSDPSNLPEETFKRLPLEHTKPSGADTRSYPTLELAMQALREAVKETTAKIKEADAEIEEVEEPVNYQPYAVVVDGEKEYCWYHAGHYAVSDKHDPSNLPPELFELLQDSNKYKSTAYLRSYYTYEEAMAALHTAQGKNKEEEVNQTQETQKYRIYLDDKAKFTVRLASACEGIANYRFLRDDIEICEWSDELEAVDYLNIHFRAEIIDPQFVAANNTALRRNS